MAITARGNFNGHDLTDIPVLNPKMTKAIVPQQPYALDPDQLIEFSKRVDHWENQPEFAEDEEDDVGDPLDEPWDHIVAQQELEDFEQADEYFGCCEDGDF